MLHIDIYKQREGLWQKVYIYKLSVRLIASGVRSLLIRYGPLLWYVHYIYTVDDRVPASSGCLSEKKFLICPEEEGKYKVASSTTFDWRSGETVVSNSNSSAPCLTILDGSIHRPTRRYYTGARQIWVASCLFVQQQVKLCVLFSRGAWISVFNGPPNGRVDSSYLRPLRETRKEINPSCVLCVSGIHLKRDPRFSPILHERNRSRSKGSLLYVHQQGERNKELENAGFGPAV